MRKMQLSKHIDIKMKERKEVKNQCSLQNAEYDRYSTVNIRFADIHLIIRVTVIRWTIKVGTCATLGMEIVRHFFPGFGNYKKNLIWRLSNSFQS